MDLALTGKTAYITGGAMGIGAAIADTLVAEGVRVAVADVAGDALDERRDGWKSTAGEAVTIIADLSTSGGCARAAQEAVEGLGGVPDILVNNVGAGHVRTFEQITDEDWLATLNLNFLSYVRTSRALVPRMADGGVVVNVASDLAKQPEPVPCDYAASKSAVLSLTKSLAIEYAPGIRVNAVCPGPIWTSFWTRPGGFAETMSAHYGLPPREAVDTFIAERHLPLGRLGEPEDVATAVAYLASPVSKYVTASSYNVDGGSVRSIL